MNRIFCIAIGLSLCLGCAAPWYRQSVPVATSVAAATESLAATPAPPQKSTTASTESVDEQALADVLAELEEIGTLDSQLKQELIADLRNTKPALWQPTVQVYRSALAYRKQQLEGGANLSPTSNPTPHLADETRVVLATADDSLVESSSAPPSAAPREMAFSAKPLAAEPAQQSSPAPNTPATAPSASAIAHDAPQPAADAPAVPAPASSPAASSPVASPPVENPPVAVMPIRHELPTIEPAAVELTWEEHLDAAVAGLETIADSDARSAEDLRRQVALRMLYLANGQREEALRPIAGLPPAQQDFWAKQLYGLATYLDHERITNAGDRAAEALRHLGEANAKLEEISTLSVRNLAFCSEVKSYGAYTKFDKYVFEPQQEILLYAEIENFKSEATEQGYLTVLRSSYQILDSRGQRVEAKEFPATEELCQNRRRDFFMRYFIWIPERIYDGQYTLQLTIEDVKAQKFNQASIQFEVKGAAE